MSETTPNEIEIHEHPDPSLKELPLTIGTFPRWPILLLIKLYQKTISPTIPSDTCRFYPTCSHYSYQAIYKYGALKGTWMSLSRVFRCNPYNSGGYDPVP